MANLRHEVYIHDGTGWNLINPLLTLSDFGINVAASEINLLSGATSNIQDQLDTLSNSTFLPLSGGTMTNTAHINAQGTPGSWIKGRDNAFLQITNAGDANSFVPALSFKTSTGAWQIGSGIDNDRFYFVFGTDTNYSSNTNTASTYYIESNGNFTGKAANVTGTVAIGNGGTGATTAAAARTNLGLGSFATRNSLAWNEITQSGADSIDEGTSDFTDNTELFSSYASNNGFADTNAKGKVYRRDAIKLYNYVKGKLTPAAIGAAASSHTHSTLSVIDRRSAAMTIQKDKTIEAFFTNNGTPNSNWWAGIHVSGWTGGYSSWEIVGPSHNADQRTTPLYVRTSNINSAWGSWRQIYDSSNKPSLSDLGAAAASHSHSTYVLKAGDTMTGNLTLPRIIVTQNSRTLTIGPQNSSFYHVYGDSETAPIALNMPIAMVGNKSVGTTSYPTSALYVTKTGGIYSVGTKQTYKMIDFIDNTSDTYGNGIAIGGGGQTIIGGGESATTAKGQAGTAGAETMWICNDGNIDFYSNCQSAWSSAQHAYFNTSGDFIIPRYYYGSYANLTGSASATHKWNYNWSGLAAFDTSGWLRTVLWYNTLYNGSFASGSTTLTNAMSYQVLILVGAMNGGARSSVTVPTAVLTTSAINFQMTDETYWVTVGLTKASNNHDVTMSYVSKNGSSYVQWVGGLN